MEKFRGSIQSVSLKFTASPFTMNTVYTNAGTDIQHYGLDQALGLGLNWHVNMKLGSGLWLRLGLGLSWNVDMTLGLVLGDRSLDTFSMNTVKQLDSVSRMKQLYQNCNIV